MDPCRTLWAQGLFHRAVVVEETEGLVEVVPVDFSLYAGGPSLFIFFLGGVILIEGFYALLLRRGALGRRNRACINRNAPCWLSDSLSFVLEILLIAGPREFLGNSSPFSVKTQKLPPIIYSPLHRDDYGKWPVKSTSSHSLLSLFPPLVLSPLTSQPAGSTPNYLWNCFAGASYSTSITPVFDTTDSLLVHHCGLVRRGSQYFYPHPPAPTCL